MSLISSKTLQFSNLVGGIEDATRNVTGQPMMAQSVLLGHLAARQPFRSVADIGCGGGNWLSAALALGAERVAGWDLVPVPDEALAVDRSLITITDLGEPLTCEQRFDLVVSTEVAEHIDQARADVFIDNLCAFSDVILFSAALPYQGGIHHVNEHWVEYWNRKFRNRDYFCYDIFRDRFWNDARIPYFYRQNCLLFVHGRWARAMADKGMTPTLEPRSLVHPELLLQAVNRARPRELRAFERDARIYWGWVENRPDPEDAHAYGGEELWGKGA